MKRDEDYSGLTDDPTDPGLRQKSPWGTGQNKKYLVLTDEERARGYVRPVRYSYVHETCGGHTTMAPALAETYARQPAFYGRTFCSRCGDHFPVGADGQFRWDDGQKVGT